MVARFDMNVCRPSTHVITGIASMLTATTGLETWTFLGLLVLDPGRRLVFHKPTSRSLVGFALRAVEWSRLMLQHMHLIFILFIKVTAWRQTDRS